MYTRALDQATYKPCISLRVTPGAAQCILQPITPGHESSKAKRPSAHLSPIPDSINSYTMLPHLPLSSIWWCRCICHPGLWTIESQSCMTSYSTYLSLSSDLFDSCDPYVLLKIGSAYHFYPGLSEVRAHDGVNGPTGTVQG